MIPARYLALAVALLAALPASRGAAQSYAFRVPRMDLTADVQPDASVRLHYEIQFDNAPGAHSIDVVDVGLPHENYDLGTMHAWVDGTPVGHIQPSSYIDVGVEVPLGLAAIAPGQSGTFVFEATMPDMVYNDTTDDEMASLRLTPTWFDPGLLQGTTDLRVLVELPPGVSPSEVRHQGLHGSDVQYRVGTVGGRTAVGWRYPMVRVDGPHLVGVSFPRRVMQRVVVITKLDLLVRWFEGSPGARFLSFLVLGLLTALVFFRFSGGTGWSVFFLAMGVLGVASYQWPRLQLFGIPVWVAVLIFMEWRLRKRRKSYLPPMATLEGGGIKRGLTAPEAAVVLELPLGRVVSLVLFGMLKKGLVRQVHAAPLTLAVPPELDVVDHGQRLKAAAKLKTVIHEYEQPFLDAIRIEAIAQANARGEGEPGAREKGVPAADVDYTDGLRALIEHVANRMETFDLSDTRDYYRSVVKRAWVEARGTVSIDARTRVVDDKLDWLLLGDDAADTFSDWDRAGYHYWPAWTRGPGTGVPANLGAPAGVAGTAGVPSPPSDTRLSDVAASFAGSFENVSSHLASTLSPLSVTPGSGGGVINLSGADSATADVLQAFFSSSGGGGGGGGGGCACACAGCACACACAGGGR